MNCEAGPKGYLRYGYELASQSLIFFERAWSKLWFFMLVATKDSSKTVFAIDSKVSAEPDITTSLSAHMAPATAAASSQVSVTASLSIRYSSSERPNSKRRLPASGMN